MGSTVVSDAFTKPVAPATAPLPVYLIHWNAPDWLRSAIDSVRASTEVDVRVTVIDNSGDLRAEDLPAGVELVTPETNGGYTGGANAALADVRRRMPAATELVVASHDLHVAPSTLATLRRALEDDPALGVVGPRLSAPAVSCGGTWDGTRARMRDVPGSTAPDWVSGTLLMLRRECIDDVGWFDTTFGSYCEDVDYCLRAGDAGWEIGVVTEAEAWGLGSAAGVVQDRIERNLVRLSVKRSGRRRIVPILAGRAGPLVRALGVGVGVGLHRPSVRRRARANIVPHARNLASTAQLVPSLLRNGRSPATDARS